MSYTPVRSHHSMSGIVGLWNRDGRPVDPTVLSQMSDTIRHRGPDGEGQRIAGPIGVACRRHWIVPEEIGEAQPIVNRAGVILAMDGRLDNRNELLDALAMPAAASDAECVLAAYGAW